MAHRHRAHVRACADEPLLFPGQLDGVHGLRAPSCICRHGFRGVLSCLKSLPPFWV